MDSDFPAKVGAVATSNLVISQPWTLSAKTPTIWNLDSLTFQVGGSLRVESDLQIAARLVQIEAGGDGSRPHILLVNASADAPTALVMDSDQISGPLLIGQEGPGRSRCSVTTASLDPNSQVQTMMQFTVTHR